MRSTLWGKKLRRFGKTLQPHKVLTNSWKSKNQENMQTVFMGARLILQRHVTDLLWSVETKSLQLPQTYHDSLLEERDERHKPEANLNRLNITSTDMFQPNELSAISLSLSLKFSIAPCYHLTLANTEWLSQDSWV